MRVQRRIEYIYFDTKPLTQEALGSENRIAFFNEADGEIAEGEVLTEVDEDPLIRWLFGKGPARGFLRDKLGMSRSARACYGVVDPFTNRQDKPGDIDIILCDPGASNQAVVMECKRVKVKQTTFDDKWITKFGNLQKGVEQANGLIELGFNRTYLCILAVVDGRGRKEYNLLARHMTKEIRSKIYDFPKRKSLNTDVGIVIIEAIQVSNRSRTKMAGVGCDIVKRPTRQNQHSSLTARVRNFVL